MKGCFAKHTHTHTSTVHIHGLCREAKACHNFLSGITFSIFCDSYSEAHLMYAQASIFVTHTHALRLGVENYKA